MVTQEKRYLSIDLQGVEPAQKKLRIHVEPGRYRVTVAAVNETVDRGGKPTLEVLLQVSGAQGMLIDNMSFHGFGRQRIPLFFYAIEADPKVDDLDSLVGKQCDADIGDADLPGKPFSQVYGYHRKAGMGGLIRRRAF